MLQGSVVQTTPPVVHPEKKVVLFYATIQHGLRPQYRLGFAWHSEIGESGKDCTIVSKATLDKTVIHQAQCAYNRQAEQVFPIMDVDKEAVIEITNNSAGFIPLLKGWIEPWITLNLGISLGAMGESLREYNIEYKASWEDENYQWVSLPSHKN
jgi:hypothetical protein